jgi:hypothetical protein
MALRMVYNTRNWWVCGVCPLSRTPNNTKEYVSETGFVVVLMWGDATPTLLGSLELTDFSHCLMLTLSKGANIAGSSPFKWGWKTSSFPYVMFFSVIENIGQWTKFKSPIIPKCSLTPETGLLRLMSANICSQKQQQWWIKSHENQY